VRDITIRMITNKTGKGKWTYLVAHHAASRVWLPRTCIRLSHRVAQRAKFLYLNLDYIARLEKDRGIPKDAHAAGCTCDE